ncbi:hypothetical protein WMY93_015262 [Mugilogobius chulae]|uniref:Uncharacterized protein n=1 Tax=Mugilogobius chulae TaxID=88201 RepID=A0AAW0NQ25_9GOBI
MPGQSALFPGKEAARPGPQRHGVPGPAALRRLEQKETELLRLDHVNPNRRVQRQGALWDRVRCFRESGSETWVTATRSFGARRGTAAMDALWKGYSTLFYPGPDFIEDHGFWAGQLHNTSLLT